jgi:hypothetical protein
MALTGSGCARCGSPYTADGIRVLAQREEIAFVQLVCSACQTQTLTLVTGGPTDSDAGEPGRRRPEAPAITEADVREMRSFLAGFEGDLRDLLQPDDGPEG